MITRVTTQKVTFKQVPDAAVLEDIESVAEEADCTVTRTDCSTTIEITGNIPAFIEAWNNL